jgi:hypothetical protein
MMTRRKSIPSTKRWSWLKKKAAAASGTAIHPAAATMIIKTVPSAGADAAADAIAAEAAAAKDAMKATVPRAEDKTETRPRALTPLQEATHRLQALPARQGADKTPRIPDPAGNTLPRPSLPIRAGKADLLPRKAKAPRENARAGGNA